MPDDIIKKLDPADANRKKSTITISWWSRFWTLRREIPVWQKAFWGLLCILTVWGIWTWVTTPNAEGSRILSATSFPSPAETFDKFHELWFDRALTRNTYASLQRVVLGFTLAAVIGIPLGVLCGCYPWINAFFTPLNLFGRNIPIAALVPLTFALFGIQELQKVMFIFLACIAFVISNTANAVSSVQQRFVDCALTLGLSRWQIIRKVIFPLSLPAIFDSLRLLFGLAFGYIMLAEVITVGEEVGVLGNIINTAQRLRKNELIYLILLIIPVVAYGIDRVLFFLQSQLFPYQYGGMGLLYSSIRRLIMFYEDAKIAIFPATPIADYDKQQEMLASFPDQKSDQAGKP